MCECGKFSRYVSIQLISLASRELASGRLSRDEANLVSIQLISLASRERICP